MEATVLSVGKSAVNGAISYAKSAVAEEVALQLGVRRDQTFITEELEMMQAFLMAAHGEPDDNRVTKIWVKQVRDVSYDVEDCLQDFAGRLGKPTWWPWHIPRKLRVRHRLGKQMKELRARVEDVSQRNLRYNLIKGSDSKPTFNCEQVGTNSTRMSHTDEANWQRDKAKRDLIRLIDDKADCLRVVAVWANNDDSGETSILRRAYQDLKKHNKFDCCAWIKLKGPFNPTKFLLSIVRQFYANYLQGARERKYAIIEGKVLRKMGMMKETCLVDEFKKYMNERNCLIVLDDLSNTEEWNHIRTYFPNNKGSRIIVSTQKIEVASLCVGPEDVAPEHKELCVDNSILYAFYEKGCQDGIYSMEAGSSSNAFGSNSSAEIKTITRTETKVSVFKESQLIGRNKEKADIIKLITNEDKQQLEVISVFGMGGLGKTALVRDVYQSEELIGKFDKRACVTLMRPFNPDDLLQSLDVQIHENESEKKGEGAEVPENKGESAEVPEKEGGVKKGKQPLHDLKGKKYLIVLDDILSSTEWDAIKQHFPATETASRIIVTTRVKKIAKHCSEKQHNMYKLESLQPKYARGLFMEKVFGRDTDWDEQYPELVEQADLILKKCSGLPLAIVTIGGFLANQPKVALEWMKLNRHISAELEMNPELETIIIVLNKSYDGLPYHLKVCFLYLSIFPEDHKASRRRLVRRWTAEGYSREFRGKSAEEIADNYFMDLISRSMILPFQQSIHNRKGVDSCQVHDLIREISISNSTEEKLVFRLEEGCSLNNQGTIRHLAINSNWEGDESEFENIVDLSRVRSVTVFGQWRTFFISDKMRLLRVLDMEDAFGVVDHHLEHIGKLIHLKYLSLRGCDGISHLPDSVGNLRQLETLDIRGTRIIKLPKSIINLQKLNCLRAGRKPMDENDFRGGIPAACLLPVLSVMLCIYWCAPQGSSIDGMNRCDICTFFCRGLLPVAAMHLDRYGVLLPRGMNKLKALHTLGVVNIARGKMMLQDIRKLNRLRKLGVTGIDKKNGEEFCSAIASLGHLESLSIRAEGEQGLCDCLDEMSSPPKNMQSLKLYGNLPKLPEWIGGLKNLVKLKLRSTRILDCKAAIQALGKIPNLTILCLCNEAFKGEEVRVNFHLEAFSSLVVLELESLSKLKSVEFEQGATPKLELLQFSGTSDIKLFSGLPSLPSLKEVHLGSDNVGDRNVKYGKVFVEHLRTELGGNPNRPVLKRH
ncbi:hypothetical protein ACQJBY_003980 [Aegilops geniculata]